MHYLHTKMLTFRVPGRPKSGQVGVKLALSWHLKGILRQVKFKMPIRSLGTGANPIGSLREGGPRREKGNERSVLEASPCLEI